MKKGFTLIELLVSISIFSVVIVISIGALLYLARAADRSHAILTAINNLDFAMEQMGRTLRVGHSYYCSNGVHPIAPETRDCTWGHSQGAVSFTDQDDRRIVYRFNKTKGTLLRENLSAVPRKVFAITSPEIFIDALNFNVFGSNPFDHDQPRVMIRIKGHTVIPTLKPEDQVSFDLQTTISQRSPDL